MAKKSTYNSKMPQPSNICIGSTLANSGTAAACGVDGVLGTCKVYFKQNKTTYPFQVQYRIRYLYKDKYKKQKNKTYTGWTEWKNARIFNSPVLNTVPLGGKQSSYPVNKWMAANKGVNKNSKYVVARDISGFKIGSNYKAAQIQYRVRSFCKSKAKHGKFASQVLTIARKTDIIHETACLGEDGGLQLRFAIQDGDSGSVILNKLADSNGVSLLREGVSRAFFSYSNDTYPPYTLSASEESDGYICARVNIPRTILTRELIANESLTSEIKFTNSLGAETTFDLTKMQPVDPSLSTGITMNVDTSTAYGAVLLTVKDTNYATDSLSSIYARFFYTVDGEEIIVKPEISKINLNSETIYAGVFFIPPQVQGKIIVTVYNNYGNHKNYTENCYLDNNTYSLAALETIKSGSDITDTLLTDFGNTIGSGLRYASAYANVDFSIKTAASNIYLQPIGTDETWGAASTNAPKTTLSFSADIFDTDDETTTSRLDAWQGIRNHLDDWFVFRTPYGDSYNIFIDNLTIEKVHAKVYSVSLSATVATEVY